MEFIHYLLGGMIDVVVLIIIALLLPITRFINSTKLNAFIEGILLKILSEEGLF